MQGLSKTTYAFAVALCSHIAVTGGALANDVLPPAVKSQAKGEVVWYDGSGGATTRAREETSLKSFVAETGVKLRADFNPDMTKFFAAMESGASVPWSFVEFGTKSEFVRAREAGYLEKLDPKIVDVAKLGDGAYDAYGVDIMRYGIVFTYNTKTFSSADAPTNIRDIYDVKKFPGKRCLFKYPQYGGVLESALLADGVTRDQLYPLDLDRAFKKLDSIKSDVIWWSNGDDAIRLLSSGECSMGIAWSGRVYNAVKTDKAPLAISWKDSLYSQGVYAVPKGAPNPAAGQALIAYFIGDVEGQKAFVQKITYTTDLKAIKLDDYGKELAPWIVAGDNATNAIEENAPYYTKNITEVIDRFNRWVALN